MRSKRKPIYFDTQASERTEAHERRWLKAIVLIALSIALLGLGIIVWRYYQTWATIPK